MKNKKIPDLYLEQALLGELPADKRSMLEGEGAAERLVALTDSNKEILEQYDPGEMADRIRRRLHESEKTSDDADIITPNWFSRHKSTVFLAAAAIVVFAGVSPFLFRQDSRIDTTTATEITRIKGMEPQIAVYRKIDGSVERLKDNALARENDLLQISYNAAGKPFGTIFSIDGRGVVTLHLPAERNGSLVLNREGEVALDFSYRLDDAPWFERFYFVASDTTFTIETVLASASDLAEQLAAGSRNGKLELPDSFVYTSIAVRKEGSR
jgi:hypothetical protein